MASSPSQLTHFLGMLLSSALTALGALMSVGRPARGFILIGAGLLASAVSVAVFSFPAVETMLERGIWSLAFGLT